jgi:hypothetical protein
VATLIVIAAVGSAALPWLLVTDPVRMWQGAGVAVALLLVSALMTRWPLLRRAEIVLPIGDFFAIGLLRFGTGDTQSVFLAIIVLPVIWIAAGRERWRIALPLVGVCVTLLLPLAFSPERGMTASELVRLLIAVMVYAAAGAVVNRRDAPLTGCPSLNAAAASPRPKCRKPPSCNGRSNPETPPTCRMCFVSLAPACRRALWAGTSSTGT